MNLWNALGHELNRGALQFLVGAAVLGLHLLLDYCLGYTKANIRFHKLKDYAHNKVTFLIRNLDSVRYRQRLILRLEPKDAIKDISVHGGPYCSTPPAEDDQGDILITFDKVPADATFSIKVNLRPQKRAKIWLAKTSKLRARKFDVKLEAFRGVRRVSYFTMRWLAGLIGFVAVLMVGVMLDGHTPDGFDWPFIGAACPLAFIVFVLVVPTGGKPIVAGYLGWSGAAKEWHAIEKDCSQVH